MKEVGTVIVAVVLIILTLVGTFWGVDKVAGFINKSTRASALALPYDQYIHTCVKKQMNMSPPYRLTYAKIIPLCEWLYETKHPKERS